MKNRNAGPIKVGQMLDGFLEERGIKDQVARMEALDIWADVVGSHVAEVTRAKGVSEGTLFVEVRTSAWLMELNMMKRDVLARVNERLPGTPLDRIVFVLAETG